MKPFWASKINWVAFVTLIFGFLTDPQFTTFIDPWWASQILKATGIITFTLRTVFPPVSAKLTLT